MKRKLQKCLTILGMIGLCIGLSGCGNDKDTAAKSTVPLERGQHIMYGSYQVEVIEWRVLDKKGDEVLLISEYGLDAQPYDTSGKNRVLWEDSTIREWLNDDFYNSAFSEDEKANIVLSFSEGFEAKNSSTRLLGGKPYYHLERGTKDKIFLLSYTEMCLYFDPDPNPNPKEGSCFDFQYGHDEVLCYPTEYAKQRLYMLNVKDACGWWMADCFYDTDGVGVISGYGQAQREILLNSSRYAVRPAMWVTWQSDMQVIEESRSYNNKG